MIGDTNSSLYDYFAGVMLEPIPLEGSDYLHSLAAQTDELCNMALSDDLIGQVELMRGWLMKSLDEMDTEEQQRLLAVDRTYLFRGVDEKGPLPPYEGFYSASKESCIATIGKAYEKANVHASNNERLDYLGQELAFISVLIQKGAHAKAQQNNVQTEALDAMRKKFQSEHLNQWVGAFCDAALPYAKTDYFRGYLNFLSIWLR